MHKVRGPGAGGIGLSHRLARRVGLIKKIDRRLHLLKAHLPYHDSDHVLNIVDNRQAGKQCHEYRALRRYDRDYLDALAAPHIPDPQTAGDFCRLDAAAALICRVRQRGNECRTSVQ